MVRSFPNFTRICIMTKYGQLYVFRHFWYNFGVKMSKKPFCALNQFFAHFKVFRSFSTFVKSFILVRGKFSQNFMSIGQSNPSLVKVKLAYQAMCIDFSRNVRAKVRRSMRITKNCSLCIRSSSQDHFKPYFGSIAQLKKVLRRF